MPKDVVCPLVAKTTRKEGKSCRWIQSLFLKRLYSCCNSCYNYLCSKKRAFWGAVMEEIEILRGRMRYQNHQLKVRWATSVRDVSHKVRSRVGSTLIELLTSKHICIIVLVSLIVATTAAIGQKEEEAASLIAKGITMLREGEFKLYRGVILLQLY